MGRVSWTFEAETWLKDIYDYIKADDPAAARRVVLEILDKAEALSQFPQMGFRYEGVAHREVRILLYEHYRIAYLVKQDGDIDILGVFHGALEINRYLF